MPARRWKPRTSFPRFTRHAVNQEAIAVTDNAPIFYVIIDAKGVTIHRIEPGRPGYKKASKDVILRERDAIERYRTLKTSGKGFDGSYGFQFLDTAKTFAMLRLAAQENDVQDNLDRVQAYDGSPQPKKR